MIAFDLTAHQSPRSSHCFCYFFTAKETGMFFVFAGGDQVMEILREHNMAMRRREARKGAVSLGGALLDPSKQNKVCGYCLI